MRQPILLIDLDDIPTLVQYDDVTAYEPYSHSCVLHFERGNSKEFKNRMCCVIKSNSQKRCSASTEKSLTHKSIRLLLEESEKKNGRYKRNG